MKRISDEKINSIIVLLDKGYSSRDIQWKVGVAYSTVNCIRRRYRKNAIKLVGGRPTKLTATDCRFLVRSIRMGKAENAVQLTNQVKQLSKINISPQAVRSILKQFDLKAILKQKSLNLHLLKSTKTGPWSNGKRSYGQKRLKSIV